MSVQSTSPAERAAQAVADASLSRNCQQLSYQEPKTYDAENTDMKITQLTFSCRNFQASAYRRFPVELVTTTSHPGHVLGQCDARFVSQSSCEQAVTGLITAAEAAMQPAGVVSTATPAQAAMAANAGARQRTGRMPANRQHRDRREELQ